MTHDRASAIAKDLWGLRFRYVNEDDLQRGLEQAMTTLGYDFEREVRITARDRLDFLVDGGVAIEVKVAGATASVVRQLERYAQHDRIEALILVTSRLRHRAPAEINGKPVIVVALTLSAL